MFSVLTPYQTYDLKILSPPLFIVPTSAFWMAGVQALGILCFSQVFPIVGGALFQ